MSSSTAIARRWASLFAGALLATALACPAFGQAPTSPPPAVYTFVEQMPQPPGGGGNTGILTLIQQRVRYPIRAMRDRAEGRVFVSFTVAASGLVEDVVVAKSFRRDCDSTVVDAVKALPRLEPGRQAGRAVPVRFTMPVTFRLSMPREVVYDSLKQVYYSAERLPVYHGKDLVGDFLREFRKVSTMADCRVPKFPVFVSLTVRPDGSIYDVACMNNQPLITPAEAAAGKKGLVDKKPGLQELPPACEVALTTAAYRLAPFTPGAQDGRNVAVRFTIQLIGAGK